MAFRYGTGIETGASSVRSRPVIMALEQRWSFGGSGVDRDGALWRWIEDKAGACGDRVTMNRYRVSTGMRMEMGLLNIVCGY